MKILNDVTIKAGEGAYLFESGDRMSLICPTVLDDFRKLASMCEVYARFPNELLIKDEHEVIDVFVEGLGAEVLEDVAIFTSEYNLMLEAGDRILLEQPSVGQSGRIPFKTIANFAKKHGGWSDEEIQNKIGEIKDLDDPKHQRDMLRQWVLEIQNRMSERAEKETTDKPIEQGDEDNYEVSQDYDEVKDDALTTYAKSPFLMKTKSAAEKLIKIIKRALISNRVQPPEMTAVRAEFGAASGKPNYKYVIIYGDNPDKTQELMTMGAAAAMAAK